MSALEVKTLQSPNNFNLTLDAQGSGSDIIIQSNGSQVASITDAGLLTATTFAGSGASLTALPAAQLTGSLPAISGASLTGFTDSQMPAGSVLQVVHAKTNTSVSMSSNTLTDTGLTATITPSSTSSKILVLLHQNGVRKNSNHSNNDVRIELQRGGTLIHLPCTYAGFTGTSIHLVLASVSTSYLDSPSSTSAVVYKTQFRNPDGGAAGGTIMAQESSAESTITLMEIAG